MATRFVPLMSLRECAVRRIPFQFGSCMRNLEKEAASVSVIGACSGHFLKKRGSLDEDTGAKGRVFCCVVRSCFPKPYLRDSAPRATSAEGSKAKVDRREFLALSAAAVMGRRLPTLQALVRAEIVPQVNPAFVPNVELELTARPARHQIAQGRNRTVSCPSCP
jgi:hypothetical protein